MSQRFYLPAILLLAFSPVITAAEPVTLTVNVTGAEPPTGMVEISVFDSEESFLKRPYVQNPCKPAGDGTCTFTFRTLVEGDYAVVVVHDANGNQKLDNGFMGFGAESYAYSNDASNPLFGRASFDAARITVAGATEIHISLD